MVGTPARFSAALGAACVVLLVLGLSACTGESNARPLDRSQVLRLATACSVEESGLLAQLLPLFEAKHDAHVEVQAEGSGVALELGRRGKADVVIAHARPLEDAFLKEGYGINRRSIMHSDFVVAGPKDDPAQVRGLGDAVKAFQQIAASEAPFLSRGDQSGTHVRELQLWRAAWADRQALRTNDGFVRFVYRLALDREGDEEGVGTNLEAMRVRKLSRAEVMSALSNSPEAKARLRRLLGSQ